MASKYLSYNGLLYFWGQLKAYFATLSHTHGNITNDGKIGSTANLPIITGTNGSLTTGSFGNSANTFCAGDDSRLSDTRTPKSHTHGNITNDGKLATASAVVVTDSNKKVLADTTVSVTELHYLDGVTSNIQTQINSLQTSINSMSSVYSVKGSCTYAQLIAKTNAKVGDVYNVTDAHDNVPAGTNYVCIVADTAGASSWDSLGGAVDLSAYMLSSDIVAITNAEIDTVVAS